MRGTCFGAKNVERIFGTLAFGDLAFDNFPIMGRDEVSAPTRGVSESVPPGGGGSRVAAAAPRTLSRACHALVEDYDTRARPFTRSEGRLRATGRKRISERARRVVSNSGWVIGYN
jgi:hypothetical protein